MTPEDRKHLIATLDMFAEIISDGGHKWEKKQRSAYEKAINILIKGE
jgi:hypothetical protein